MQGKKTRPRRDSNSQPYRRRPNALQTELTCLMQKHSIKKTNRANKQTNKLGTDETDLFVELNCRKGGK